jgi:CubicO group peptidase (beta-lactamase class C family)
MRKIKLTLLILCAHTITYGQAVNSRLVGFDKEVQDILKAFNGVGASIAIVENNQVVYAKGFGFRDAEKKLPVTANTVFPIGSITKSFTSALIGMLEDQKMLATDQKPSFYIPKLQFYNDRMNDLITIKDLLMHRSGIGAVDGTYLFFPAASRMELMERVKYLKPNAAVNDSYRYSNFGYAMLGAIVEQVSQKSWEQNVEDRIFKPLKMNRSSTYINDMIKTGDYSNPYGVYNKEIKSVLFGELDNDKPGGGINSTANDMANWMRMWLNNGVYENDTLLSRSYVQNAMSIKNIYKGTPPDSTQPDNYIFGYGYGWNVNSYKGHYRVHHGGAVSGFSADVVMFPTDKIGIVVLTNQHNTSLPYVLANMTANRMLKISANKPYAFTPELNNINVVETNAKPVNNDKKPTHPLGAYCGKYASAGYGTFEITLEDGSLYATFPRLKYRLEHNHYNLFTLKFIKEIPQIIPPDFELHFTLNAKGEIAGVNIDLQREDVLFEKK